MSGERLYKVTLTFEIESPSYRQAENYIRNGFDWNTPIETGDPEVGVNIVEIGELGKEKKEYIGKITEVADGYLLRVVDPENDKPMYIHPLPFDEIDEAELFADEVLGRKYFIKEYQTVTS